MGTKKKREKVEPLPKERLEAAALRLQTKVADSLRQAHLDRLRDWGMTKFQLARRAERPQPMMIRMMTPEGVKGLGMIGMIAEACGCDLDFKIVDITTLKPFGEAE